MPDWLRTSRVVLALAVALGVVALVVSWPVTNEAQSAGPAIPRVEGRPDLSGIWQTINEANWNLEAHGGRPAAITQQGHYEYEYARVPAAAVLALGAAGIVPPSQGVVQGDGRIPYKPEALATKRENEEHWVDRDPELRCHLPGVPRATYMPSPFQIVHGTDKIEIAYQFSNGARTIHLDEVGPPPDVSYLGHSVGRWEDDTLVVTVTALNDKTWFDRAGNFHSDALTVTERYTLMTADAIRYEATIDDPNVFTRPWTITMPLYRRLEPNALLLENRCIDSVEEFLYGGLRREPLATHWESETMIVDVQRRVPEGEALYKWWFLE